MNEAKPITLVSSTTVYENPWITVTEDRVINSRGNPGVFGVVRMKEGSSVLPVTRDQHVYLVKEFKYGIDSYSIELMSGGLDTNESPQEAAQRELREELGLSAATWTYHGYVDPFTTIVSSRNHLFIATNLSMGHDSPDENESIEKLKIELSEAIRMVERGRITHSASCVLILRAARMFGL